MSEIETGALFRIRFTYARLQPLRYTSHLDMQMVWERTLRRAALPLAYSRGFRPSPRLHHASALPLGFLSRCEITDVWVALPEGADAPDLTSLARQVQAAAPPGLEIRSVELAPLDAPPLQTLVQAAVYTAQPLDPLAVKTLRERASALLAAPTLPRERRGKSYDLRPLIQELVVEDGSPPRLTMRLAAQAGSTGRPEEVLDAMGLDWPAFRVERVQLILV